MKLRFSPFSAYARKVVVVAMEGGLESRIERVHTTPNEPGGDLHKDNPLGKLPALITDDGEALYDSPVICEYLDSLSTGTKVFPASGKARWAALRFQALADGILDAAALCREEGRRPADKQSADWVARQMGKIRQGLDELEKRSAELEGPLTIGQITAGCALGYLDFRFAAEEWRKTRPNLAKWFESFMKRPSMQATIHKA